MGPLGDGGGQSRRTRLRDKLSIWFDDIRVAAIGRAIQPMTAQTVGRDEERRIELNVALNLGRGEDRVLTCDLTKEYVAINGDYRR